MKKSLRICIILAVLVMIAFTINVEPSYGLSFDNIASSAEDFLNEGKKNQLISDDKIINAVLPVGQMLTGIGVAVLFGALVVLGIKYMVADPQQKAKLKQQLIGLVISGVVIFGAYTIWSIAYNFFEDIF